MKKIILFNAPSYGNIGDLAIAIAEKKFIKENLPQYEYIEILDKEIENEIEKMKKILTTDDIILLTGGGNLGDEYMDHEGRRRRVIEEFPNNKIVVMPQTIYFNDTEYGTRELEKAREIYNKHKHLTLIARERISLDIMKREFPSVNILLTPDIVMYLKEENNEKRDGAVMAMRSDSEKVLTIENMEKIKSEVSKNFDNIVLTDTHLGEIEVSENIREKVVQEKLDEFKKAQLVITDRLHGMIFAAVTSTPCIVFSNYNHKIKSSFEWLKDQGYIKFLENVDNIGEAILDLKNCGEVQYNNDFAIKEYNKILEIIESNKNI